MTNAPTTICRYHSDVAEIQLVNLPVNGLGWELRHSLHEHLSEVLGDARVRAVVLTGSGKMFCGGADIHQFNTAKATMQPMLRDINCLIESSGKPVIAAIHGNALGGGLELAMSCHYRMATMETRLALPEVKLGILPGGGGTQRLPRLVGLEVALGLIVSGDAIDASQAHAYGLIDEIVSSDLLEAALMQARLAAQQPPSSLRVTSALSVRFDGDMDSYFEAQRSRLAQIAPGLPAPLECLSCLKASLILPFEQALTLERAKVQALLDSPESKELRRQFFARREASRLTSNH